jgi:hypothetical protein
VPPIEGQSTPQQVLESLRHSVQSLSDAERGLQDALSEERDAKVEMLRSRVEFLEHSLSDAHAKLKLAPAEPTVVSTGDLAPPRPELVLPQHWEAMFCGKNLPPLRPVALGGDRQVQARVACSFPSATLGWLDLSGSELADEHIPTLCTALAAAPHVRCLDLSRNAGLTEAGATLLAPQLATAVWRDTPAPLVSFDISYCDVGQVGRGILLEALLCPPAIDDSPRLSPLHGLTHLGMTFVEDPVEQEAAVAAASASKDPSESPASIVGSVAHLASLLRTSHSLRSLNLSGSNIGLHSLRTLLFPLIPTHREALPGAWSEPRDATVETALRAWRSAVQATKAPTKKATGKKRSASRHAARPVRRVTAPKKKAPPKAKALPDAAQILQRASLASAPSGPGMLVSLQLDDMSMDPARVALLAQALGAPCATIPRCRPFPGAAMLQPPTTLAQSLADVIAPPDKRAAVVEATQSRLEALAPPALADMVTATPWPASPFQRLAGLVGSWWLSRARQRVCALPFLQRLSMRRCGLTDAAVATPLGHARANSPSLATAVGSHPHLVRLDLSQNDLSDAGLGALSEAALLHSSSLRIVDLSFSKASSSAIHTVLGTWADAPSPTRVLSLFGDQLPQPVTDRLLLHTLVAASQEQAPRWNPKLVIDDLKAAIAAEPHPDASHWREVETAAQATLRSLTPSLPTPTADIREGAPLKPSRVDASRAAAVELVRGIASLRALNGHTPAGAIPPTAQRTASRLMARAASNLHQQLQEALHWLQFGEGGAPPWPDPPALGPSSIPLLWAQTWWAQLAPISAPRCSLESSSAGEWCQLPHPPPHPTAASCTTPTSPSWDMWLEEDSTTAGGAVVWSVSVPHDGQFALAFTSALVATVDSTEAPFGWSLELADPPSRVVVRGVSHLGCKARGDWLVATTAGSRHRRATEDPAALHQDGYTTQGDAALFALAAPSCEPTASTVSLVPASLFSPALPGLLAVTPWQRTLIVSPPLRKGQIVQLRTVSPPHAAWHVTEPSWWAHRSPASADRRQLLSWMTNHVADMDIPQGWW